MHYLFDGEIKLLLFVFCMFIARASLFFSGDCVLYLAVMGLVVSTCASWKHTRLRNVLIIIHTCPLTGQVCCSYTGVVCAGGSDAPVESPQPLLGIYDCIYRPADGNRRETSQQFKLVECEGLRRFGVFLLVVLMLLLTH